MVVYNKHDLDILNYIFLDQLSAVSTPSVEITLPDVAAQRLRRGLPRLVADSPRRNGA